jgi:hypothetical protein
MTWLWSVVIAWISAATAVIAWWSRHRRLEKRAAEIQQRLRRIGRLRATEARLERDHAYAAAARRRLIEAAALRNAIPHQTRRTEDPR